METFKDVLCDVCGECIGIVVLGSDGLYHRVGSGYNEGSPTTCFPCQLKWIGKFICISFPIGVGILYVIRLFVGEV